MDIFFGNNLQIIRTLSPNSNNSAYMEIIKHLINTSKNNPPVRKAQGFFST